LGDFNVFLCADYENILLYTFFFPQKTTFVMSVKKNKHMPQLKKDSAWRVAMTQL